MSMVELEDTYIYKIHIPKAAFSNQKYVKYITTSYQINKPTPSKSFASGYLHQSSAASPLQQLSGVRNFSSPSSDFNSYNINPPSNWGIRIVPERKACVIERFGKFRKTLPAGIHFHVPLVDCIAYVKKRFLLVIRLRPQRITLASTSMVFSTLSL
ncbi:unnamed protein product [Arabidopsis lyrata]|nr:unnamed protein product [Arabidopsis lyrata]